MIGNNTGVISLLRSADLGIGMDEGCAAVMLDEVSSYDCETRSSLSSSSTTVQMSILPQSTLDVGQIPKCL